MAQQYPAQGLGPNSGWSGFAIPVLGNLFPNLDFLERAYPYAQSLADRSAAGLPTGYGGSEDGEGASLAFNYVQRVGKRFAVFQVIPQPLPVGPGVARMAGTVKASPKQSILQAYAARPSKKAPAPVVEPK